MLAPILRLGTTASSLIPTSWTRRKLATARRGGRSVPTSQNVFGVTDGVRNVAAGLRVIARAILLGPDHISRILDMSTTPRSPLKMPRYWQPRAHGGLVVMPELLEPRASRQLFPIAEQQKPLSRLAVRALNPLH